MLSALCALLLGASITAAAPTTANPAFLGNQRRQECWSAVWDTPKLVGDGWPHQNYKYIQLTSNTDCNGNVGCEIARTEVEGQSFGWSAGVSVDGWISGGFEVTEYAESGEVSNCQGETGDVICVFWRAAYTDYTVSVEDLCTLEPTYETVISSPNADGLGSTYLCAKNQQCVNEGYEFWNTNGAPEGGPQVYPFDDDFSLGAE